jgi:prepilin-type N-terminal cleavage/methylation domain-containing protein
MAKPFQSRTARRGYTIVEVLIATAISALVAIAAVYLTTMARRMEKSVASQQRALADAQKIVENLNTQIRMAATPLSVVDAAGNPATQGNRVVFARDGESAGKRAFELKSVDSDMTTPGDNTLIYDPDTSKAGDEIKLGRMISATDSAGAFRYVDSRSPLQTFLRAGDPSAGSGQADANARTGANWQGVEINVSVAPRN